MFFFKNKKGSELTEKIMVAAFSVAAASAVILYMSNVIIESKEQRIRGVLPSVNSRFIPESEGTDGLIYTQEGNAYIVSGYEGSSKNITVPSEHNNLDVIAIGERALRDKDIIETLTLGDGIKEIRYCGVTSCRYLTSISLPESLETIGNNAFEGCWKLKSATIPNSVTTLGNLAFYSDPELASVSIGTGIKTIGDYAFMHCTKLTSVELPDGLEVIGDTAFNYCAFESIEIPNTVKTIKSNAFANCSKLKNFTVPPLVTSIYTTFPGCSSLTNVSIHNNVTAIGYATFNRCSAMESIYIPLSVTRIENNAFTDCSRLTINVAATEKPSGWNNSWNCGRPVNWGV